MFRCSFTSVFAAVSLVVLSGSASAQGFNYPDFQLKEGLKRVSDDADASPAGKFRLTEHRSDNSTAVWQTTKQSLQYGFDTTFQFQITNLWPQPPMPVYGTTGPQTGGDGFAFVIQNDKVNAIGPNGGASLAYGGTTETVRFGDGNGGILREEQFFAAGIKNAFAIEFDTFQNPEYNDPNDNHISVHPTMTHGEIRYADFNESFSAGRTIALPNMSDGEVHTVRIHYVPGTLRIYMDDLTHPALRLSLTLDLPADENGAAWVGFTAGQAAARQDQDLLNWSYSTTPGEVPAGEEAGDANADGERNILDVVATLQAVVGIRVKDAAADGVMDVNRDGSVDVRDVTLMLQDIVIARS